MIIRILQEKGANPQREGRCKVHLLNYAKMRLDLGLSPGPCGVGYLGSLKIHLISINFMVKQVQYSNHFRAIFQHHH